MSVDVLVLNSAAVDFRRDDFSFTDKLVGEGGLARCETRDMPHFSQDQFHQWIIDGFAVPGGLGNTAPLIAAAGLKTAVGMNLGCGDYSGLDAQGSFFLESMTSSAIDTSAVVTNASLPTGTTFIHNSKAGERLGIVYFPNANDAFDFEIFKTHVERLQPSIVYYMYSGLSRKGDENGGRDLAGFMRWCRSRGAVVIADSHTLTGTPRESIDSAVPVADYGLLEPLLPELDIFFTSSDESRLIHNTLVVPEEGADGAYRDCETFLDILTRKYLAQRKSTRFWGVTVSDGAYEKHVLPDGYTSAPTKIKSRFMDGEVIDLVGAGDSFRAGLIAYVARNLNGFRDGTMDFAEAVQMGNLFASCYIKAPLGQRNCIKPYEQMITRVRNDAI
ncbi:MAG: carbohydrate kinase family protein [Acidobacteriia bacterium]|nr:carbohydrate kinase family protein [Terriglobia bacterium]